MTLLDTPLSGTGAQALTGDLVVFASGDSAAIASVTDVFEGFSRAQYELGAFGNGSRMKFVANLLVAIHNVAAGEAFALGIKAGLDPETIYEVIASSAATSRLFELRGPQMVANDYTNVSASIEMQLKDMKVIGDFLAELGCAAPLFAASGQVYNAALGPGAAGRGHGVRLRGAGGACGGGEVGQPLRHSPQPVQPGRASKGSTAPISSGAKWRRLRVSSVRFRLTAVAAMARSAKPGE